MGMFEEIVTDINERTATHINSMCATADEVRICWLICEIERLRGLCEANGIDHKEKRIKFRNIDPRTNENLSTKSKYCKANIKECWHWMQCGDEACTRTECSHYRPIKFNDLSAKLGNNMVHRVQDCKIPEVYCRLYDEGGPGACIQFNCTHRK